MVKGLKFINTLNKWFSNKWFNLGYLLVSFIINQMVQGLGWAMAFIYFIGCAFIDMHSFTDN